MKKLILLLGSAMLFTFSASAQTEKGTVMLGLSGGNFGYTHNKDTDDSSFSADLYPTAGIFIADNFLVGANLSLGYYRSKHEQATSTYSSRYTSYGLGPFARYYVPSSSKHRFFVEAGAAFYHSSNKSKLEQEGLPAQQENQRDNSIGFRGALGYNYFLTQNVAFEAKAGYYHNDLGGAYSQGSLHGQLGLSIFLQKRQPAAPQP